MTLLTDAIPLLEHEEVGDFGCVCFFFLSFSFQIFINNELLAVMNNKIYPGYWFARDVTAAMLVVRDNSISLLEELNSIFVEILRKQFFLFTTNIAALSGG